jgi:hypothetical protein
MRTLLCAVALAACAAAAPILALAQDSGSDRWDARLTAVTGEVVVHPAGGGDEVEAEADMPLEEGDRVVTSADSTAELSLDGGSLITLSANSDFTLEDTRKSASIFSLALGSLIAKIEKLGAQNLSVRSPSSVAAVRGTEFGVDVEGEGSHVGVFDEGRVEVKGGSGAAEVLTPNQETSVARGQAPMKAAPLRRFAARREMMRERVRRLQVVRRNWKPFKAAKRRAARAATLRRLRRRRLNNLKKRGQPADRKRRQQPRRQKPRRKDGVKPQPRKKKP